MKGQGNTAEKAAAFSKFSKKDIKSVRNIHKPTININKIDNSTI